MQAAEHEKNNFVMNPMLNGQPVERNQYWDDIITFGPQGNYACCSIQHSLKLLKRAGWQVHKKRIAVVYSSRYEAVDKCGT